MIDTFQQALQQALSTDLPGQEAQYAMAHGFRRPAVTVPPDARQAGVMALFYPRKEAIHLSLIVRTSNNPNDRHGGQVGFPGGKFERGDSDLSYTARRETEEEIGVTGSDIQLVGKLTELFIPVSHFLVHPYVGTLPYEPEFTPQWEEVQAVLEVPLPHLLDVNRRKVTNIQINKQLTLKEVPYFDLSGRIVWGATAMMLNELIEVIETSDLPV